MANSVLIKKKLENFKKIIKVSSDKSLSIRWALMASQAVGKSRAYNLLESEYVKSCLNSKSKLGTKVIKKKKIYEIIGNGLNGYSYKNNTVINANNSGTTSRLLVGCIAKSKNTIILFYCCKDKLFVSS